MIDLGTKNTGEMYPTASDAKKVSYPNITLPLSILDGVDYDLEDDITVILKGKVKGLMKQEWGNNVSIEVDSGEVEGKPEE